jgi:hypothetical protein
MKSQMKSVYGSDYTDVYRRLELAHLNPEVNISLPQLPSKQQNQDNKTGLTTENRFNYQKPTQPDLLKNNTTRFGSRI